jgi:hypothetical protein
MTRFFAVSDNGIYDDDQPTVEDVLTAPRTSTCTRCGANGAQYAGALEVSLARDIGRSWPDVLSWSPFLAVAQRVIDALHADGAGDFPRHDVIIRPPLPRRLEGMPPPRYSWLHGARMGGALLDFDASGFVGVRICEECGRRTDNIGATHRRRQAVIRHTLRRGTWTDSHLFTTDWSPNLFFCTNALVSCTVQKHFTNFLFLPTELDDERQFWGVSDDTMRGATFPRVIGIADTGRAPRRCPACGNRVSRWTGTVEVALQTPPDIKSPSWPDVLGGAIEAPLIVSTRVIQTWEDAGLIGRPPIHPVTIRESHSAGMPAGPPPPYVWFDGHQMRGAELEYATERPSGKYLCATCGYARGLAPPPEKWPTRSAWPYTFRPGSWTGAHLFTTDLSHAAFFCTDAVLKCAERNRFTNFRFVPIEQGPAIGSPPITYLK